MSSQAIVSTAIHISKPVATQLKLAAQPWLLMLFVLSGLGIALPLNAQNTAPPSAGAELPQELLKSLQEFRKLQNGAPDLSLPSASNVPGEDPYQQRLRSIQQRMELIRSLVQQRQAAEEQAKLNAAQNPAPSGNQATIGDTAASQGEVPQPNAAQPSEQASAAAGVATPPEFPLPELVPNSEAANSDAEASKAPKFIGETVVPSAVDPLELANSLFQTGNYDLALKTYLAVADKVDKPQDALWTDYFVASCYRILGDLPTAEKGYRSLVESRRPTRPVEVARWWLDNVERRKSIAATLNDLDASLKAVSEERNANGNKK
jgi:tetratricopeptide (TPR) repeat protein